MIGIIHVIYRAIALGAVRDGRPRSRTNARTAVSAIALEGVSTS